MLLLDRILVCAVSIPVVLGATAAKKCYYPGGTEATDRTPCNGTAEVSHCCKNGEHCLTNGLCVIDATEQNGVEYLRGACTDSSFQSDACPTVCLISMRCSWVSSEIRQLI